MHQHKVPPSGLANALFVAVLGLWAWPASGLAKPAELSAVAGDGNVTLSWQAVAGATGYQYRQRKAEDVGYNSWAGTATATSTSHTVTPLHNGTAYSFQVRAVGGSEYGPASDAATTTPFAPCGGESVNRSLAGDCEALLTSKGKLDPGGTLNWRRSRALSEWTGIVTSAGRITGLRCPAGGLTGGELADSLGRLTGLTVLNLFNCRLSGPIPSSLGSLRDLEALYLEGNAFEGTIPAELGNLAKLRGLSIGGGNSKLTAGPVPAWMTGLTNLEDLYLAGSNRTGVLPAALGRRLTKLRWLFLQGNQFTDISAAASLTNLELLRADGNKLSGTMPDLSRLTKLKRLWLHGNRIEGGIPKWLGSLRDLEVLHLEGNAFEGAIPAELGNLTKLIGLSIGGGNSNLTAGPVPAWVAGLTNLEDLYLAGSNRTGALPAALGRMTKLRWLFLQGNQLTDISAAASLTNLELLRADGNKLSGTMPDLSRLTKLKRLSLHSNQIKGGIPTWLGSLRDLEVLHLEGNEFVGAIPAELGNLARLIGLSVGGGDSNFTAGPVPAWVAGLTNLEDLYLAGSNRTGVLPAALGRRLTKLRWLFLQGNQITDISAAASLTNLKLLRAEGNKLSGAMPDLSRLTKLKRLSLNGNRIEGGIPTWLGSLRDLEVLHLEGNKFVGAIPAELGNLTKLIGLSIGSGDSNFTAGPVPAWVAGLTNLEDLYLAGSNRTGALPAALGRRLTKLRWLFLQGNSLTDISAAASLRNLELLRAGSNKLSGAMPNLSRLTKLKQLSLYRNQIEGGIPKWLGSLRDLEVLYLEGNQFDGAIPAELGNLAKLIGLSIGGGDTDFTAGPVPAWVAGLTNLQDLYLADSNRTGTLPAALGRMTQLRWLFLQGNSLTNISAAASLHNLELLRADGNDLPGSIPDLSRLTKLRDLSLANNELSGTIPDWLGSLIDLKHLQLNNNDLAGNIPPKLGDLTKLVKLSLSGNALTGCIPSSLASHAATINPQQDGSNLCIQNASGQAPANNAYAFANPVPRHGETPVAHGDRIARAGFSLNASHGLADNDGDALGSVRRMRPSSHAMASPGFSFAPMRPRPIHEQRLRTFGPSVVLDMRGLFPFSSVFAHTFGTRRYVSTSQATALARATTIGDLLILTPNQRGLRGETTVTVTAIERGLGTSAQLRVVVQSTPQLPKRRPGE